MTQPLTTKTVLERALAIIEDPEHWTQGAYARHANGRPIGPLSNEARCWCSLGAISKATGWDRDDANIEAFNALHRVSEVLGGLMPHDFNDNRTHAEVVEMFNRAIAACEEVGV